MMKKIAIDCRCLEYRTGVSRYLLNILDNIFDEDKINRYYLITPQFYDTLKKYEGISNVEIINLPTKHHFIYKFYKIRRFLKKINANIYWSPTQDTLLFKIKQCKIITSVHDIAFEHHRDWFGFRINILARLGLYKRFVQNADFILYVSNFTKEDVENTYKINKESITTYLGSSDVFKKIEKSVAKKYVAEKFNINNKYIFYLDTVRFEKLFDGFKLLLDKTPNIDLVCLGGFGGQNVLDYAKKIGVENNIKWINYRVSDTELNNLYSGAEFFISPSYYEGFGLTPLEALQSGTPIIISNVTSLPEVFQDSALYINPYNSSDIYEKMLELLCNDDLKKDLLNKSLNIISKYNF